MLLIFISLFVSAQPNQATQQMTSVVSALEQSQLQNEQVEILKQRIEILEEESNKYFDGRNLYFNILICIFGVVLTFISIVMYMLRKDFKEDAKETRDQTKDILQQANEHIKETKEKAEKILKEAEVNAKKETDRILQESENKLTQISDCQKKAQEYSANLKKINITKKVGDISIEKAKEIINDSEAPDSLKDWANAIIAFGNKKYNEAINKFNNLLINKYKRELSADELISVFSYLSDCCYKLAEVTEDKEDRKNILEKTLMYLDSYTTLFPLDNAYWSNKGDVFYELAKEETNKSLASKHKDEAIDCYDKAIVLVPDYDIAWNNKGIVLASYTGNKTTEAIKCFDKAIKIKPQKDNVYYHRGLAYEKLQNTEKALSDFKKALELNPNNMEAKINKEKLERTLNETS